jgi:endonuclease III
MNINDILKNEQIAGILKKTGISEKQVNSVVNTALSSISRKNKENPKQTASLLSANENTDEDNAYSNLIESDFVQNLIKKVGLSESAANQVKTVMPQIIKQVSSNVNSKASKEGNGLEDIISSVFSGFSENSGAKSGGKNNSIVNSITGFIGGFFKK